MVYTPGLYKYCDAWCHRDSCFQRLVFVAHSPEVQLRDLGAVAFADVRHIDRDGPRRHLEVGVLERRVRESVACKGEHQTQDRVTNKARAQCLLVPAGPRARTP